MPEAYRLKVAGPAARSLEKVPERVAGAVVEFMTGRLLENPHRIGKPLLGRFVGLHAARVRDYRVRYRIDEDSRTVVVVHVGLAQTPTDRSSKIAQSVTACRCFACG